MDDSKLKIFFMGSGIFAVPVLEAIVNSDRLETVGVATQPDRAAGRKHVLTPTPLGKWADEHGWNCQRVQSVNTPEFLDTVRKAAPDIIVVVSFGQLLKEEILNMPRLGCFNVHASLLPKYRGASPIASAVLNGEEMSGVTFMLMNKGLDTGPILEMHRFPIPEGFTTGDLEKELSELAGRRIEECLLRLAAGEIKPEAQPPEGVTVSVKIRKSDGAVDWSEDAMLIARKVLAYHDWPSMTFRIQLKNRIISAKITKAKGTSWASSDCTPGKFVAYTNNQMMIRCGTGSLMIERIIPEGKKEMSVADFLNGCRLSVGEILLNGMPPQPPPASNQNGNL